jgi:hypothetical protein
MLQLLLSYKEKGGYSKALTNKHHTATAYRLPWPCPRNTINMEHSSTSSSHTALHNVRKQELGAKMAFRSHLTRRSTITLQPRLDTIFDVKIQSLEL